MIFIIRSPKGIFGQNMSDLRNGSLTGVSRSYQSAILKFDDCTLENSKNLEAEDSSDNGIGVVEDN